MTTNQANEVRALIAQARRQLAYLTATRGRYTNPGRWARLRADRLARATAGVETRTRESASLAVRWAIADATRDTRPEAAVRADDELHRRCGLTVADLDRERDDAYQQGLRDAEARQDPATASDAVVPSLAAVKVGVMVYAGATNGAGLVGSGDTDGAPAPEVDAGAADAVPAGSADLEPPVGGAIPETVSADEVAPAELPDGLFPYSIDEALVHVAAGGTHGPEQSADGFGMDSGPVTGTGLGV
ncbi:hypothetical protein CXF35_00620 [Corynebacterium bovis]|uniref:Uncharacterized protein n=1 Tax=Corynebacterium bovis TaxID=36808 RepID=A0A426Q498_9CORY|nr:hypothetical protein [Corynebacterium bovis]RRO92674.1 hypothetical protein CXF40_03085 [Corynebacterium bovis]RRO98614.1 hypothetical protein CXF32_00255 [Corynebacterium bovis]RRO99693.1 hypothetical protein CXF41_09035 [Corynebacterium bovis]RRQ00417.1 hypothetical protein CXF31_00690 [Corynebacterium bovis]RRQ03514.1 hypothetical protein CXF42_06835 [Corynebacterium bovis]